MFKYSKDGISVLAALDKRRVKQSGLFPVKIQVVYNRKQHYYSTGKELNQEDWADLADTKSKKLISIRSDIKNSFEKVEDAVRNLVEDGYFSFDALNIRLSKRTGDTLITAVKAKINSLESEGRIGTRNFYEKTMKNITLFNGENVKFSDITTEWLKKFENHMLKEGKTYATIGMHMRDIRTIINDAIRTGAIKENQYPFGKGKYEIPSGEGRKMALTMQ